MMNRIKKGVLTSLTVLSLLLTTTPAFAEDGWTQCSKSPNDYYRIEGNLTYWKSGAVYSSDPNAPGHWEEYQSGAWKFIFEDGYKHLGQWLMFNGSWYYVDSDGIMYSDCTMWGWDGNCYVMDGSGKMVNTYYDASLVFNG